MAGYGRPDVYINESLAQSSPSFFPGLTPAAFVGYTRQGPTTPTLVTSWTQFQRLYGGFSGTIDDNMALQVYQFFNNGGSYAFITRVLGAGSAIASLTLEDRQGTPADLLILSAENPGAWGDTVYVEIVDTTVTGRFNLNVRLGSASGAPIERFNDLSMNPADPRNAVNMLNAGSTGSSYIVASTPNGWVYDPATGTPVASTVGSGGTALAGGADSTAPPTTGATGQIITAVHLLDTGLAGQNGLILNLIGITDNATLNAAIAYVEGRGDSFLICDPGFGQTSSQIATTKEALSQSSYGATYWPNIYISDPASSTPGATRLISPSGSVMGQIAVTDATRGTAKAPAGVNTALKNVLALELPRPTPTDYDTIAQASVNGIRYFQNYGYVIWGSATLKSTGADSQISIRRTLMAIENDIKAVTLFAVEEINDGNLWYEISTQVAAVLQQLYQMRGLKGDTPEQAYFVTCDSTNNTPQTISAREVHVTVGVALQEPALFIIINIGQYAGQGTQVLESV